jgi:hypothetical protein
VEILLVHYSGIKTQNVIMFGDEPLKIMLVTVANPPNLPPRGYRHHRNMKYM